MEENPKLRAKKAAKLKLAILQATIDLIRDGGFKELHISDLCNRTSISKVTLFKYFPKKEDILLYYMRIWTFHLAVDLQTNKKKGVAGVYYIVDNLSESYERHPGLALSFLGHLANTRIIQKPFPVKEEERRMLYPNEADIGDIEIKSMEQLLENFLLEAILSQEITKSGNPKDFAYSIVSILYGTLLTAHIHRIRPSKLYFRRNVDLVLNGLR
jgi:AcrR family transcriptional regulator